MRKLFTVTTYFVLYTMFSFTQSCPTTHRRSSVAEAQIQCTLADRVCTYSSSNLSPPASALHVHGWNKGNNLITRTRSGTTVNPNQIIGTIPKEV